MATGKVKWFNDFPRVSVLFTSDRWHGSLRASPATFRRTALKSLAEGEKR